MWNEIVNLAIKNGLWAVLFLGLFIFVIKDSTSREKKYHQIIKDLTSHLGIVKEIKEDVDEIKNIVFKNKKSDTRIKQSKKNASKAQENDKNIKINEQNVKSTKNN